MTAPTAPHTHRWACSLPHEGVSHGVCACGAERDFHDPDWTEIGQAGYRRERVYAKCPHCEKRFHAGAVQAHTKFCRKQHQEARR